MKEGLSTNKSMSVFYGRVINAVESKDLVAIVKVCAGKLSLPLLYKIAGCGDATIPFDMVQTAIDAGAEIATTEMEFCNAFYKSMSRDLAFGFCHALQEEYESKKVDTFVFVDDCDIPTDIEIISNGESKVFAFGYGMSDNIDNWLSAR